MGREKHLNKKYRVLFALTVLYSYLTSSLFPAVAAVRSPDNVLKQGFSCKNLPSQKYQLSELVSFAKSGGILELCVSQLDEEITTPLNLMSRTDMVLFLDKPISSQDLQKFLNRGAEVHARTSDLQKFEIPYHRLKEMVSGPGHFHLYVDDKTLQKHQLLGLLASEIHMYVDGSQVSLDSVGEFASAASNKLTLFVKPNTLPSWRMDKLKGSGVKIRLVE